MSFVRLYYNQGSEFDRAFEDALTTRLCPLGDALSTQLREVASQEREVYHPRVDIHESKETNTVTATLELPGLTGQDISIDVEQNRLTVSGESIKSESEEGRSYVVQERRSGKFSRALQLPFGTKLEDVKAKMENGILTIRFPKISPEQQAKRIVVE